MLLRWSGDPDGPGQPWTLKFISYIPLRLKMHALKSVGAIHTLVRNQYSSENWKEQIIQSGKKMINVPLLSNEGKRYRIAQQSSERLLKCQYFRKAQMSPTSKLNKNTSTLTFN